MKTRKAVKSGKPRKFRAELVSGHKGLAVIVPFDPEKVWGAPPRPVASPTYGVRPGHLVRGTLNSHPFEGWIGNRWGRFFLLVGEALQSAAGVSPGDVLDVTLRPRPPRLEDDDEASIPIPSRRRRSPARPAASKKRSNAAATGKKKPGR